MIAITGKALKGFGLTLAVICAVVPSSFARTQKSEAVYDPPSVETIQTFHLDSELKRLLGDHYSDFKRRFESSGYPVHLRSGQIFIDGWKDGAYDKHAAAILFSPDGNLSVAYYNALQMRLDYWGTRDDAMPIPLRIWRKRFPQHITIRRHPTSAEQINSRQFGDDGLFHSKEETALTAEQSETMRKIAASIWGDAVTQGIAINPDVIDVILKANSAIRVCSNGFSRVPKPPLSLDSQDVLFLINHADQLIAYNKSLYHDRIYQTCIVTVAANYRSDLEMASLGIM